MSYPSAYFRIPWLHCRVNLFFLLKFSTLLGKIAGKIFASENWPSCISPLTEITQNIKSCLSGHPSPPPALNLSPEFKKKSSPIIFPLPLQRGGWKETQCSFKNFKFMNMKIFRGQKIFGSLAKILEISPPIGCFCWNLPICPKSALYLNLVMTYCRCHIENAFGRARCAWPQLYEWTESNRYICVCLIRCQKINFIPKFIIINFIPRFIPDHTHLKWLGKFDTTIDSLKHAKELTS